MKDNILNYLIGGALILGSIIIVCYQINNLINFTANMEDITKMFMAVVFMITGLILIVNQDGGQA